MKDNDTVVLVVGVLISEFEAVVTAVSHRGEA